MLEENDNRVCGCNQKNNMIQTSVVAENCNNDRREEMLAKIQELDFAIEDLALYLDTHPEDQRALCLHREYAKQMKGIKDMYQRVYGPLSINYPCNKWRWLEEPWPWERGNN